MIEEPNLLALGDRLVSGEYGVKGGTRGMLVKIEKKKETPVFRRSPLVGRSLGWLTPPFDAAGARSATVLPASPVFPHSQCRVWRRY